MVLVQASVYGTDNSCQLDAAAVFGLENARVVVDIDENTITDKQLQDLYDRGARGLRVNVQSNQPLRDGIAEKVMARLLVLESMIKNTDWYLELMFPDWLIYELYDGLKKLHVPYCFAHFGMQRVCSGPQSSSCQAMLSLMKDGYCWVKLSAPYRISIHPTYADVVDIGRAIFEAAPEHVVFGTDYPHVNATRTDTVTMFNVLSLIAPDEAERRRILVENPEVLFGFAPVPSPEFALTKE
jgi:predicted TIM-barrel fold metal-dependent hydrolase